MKTLIIAAVLAAPAVALAQNSATPHDERGFHARLLERYCEKLREGPEPYVQFVRRLKPVHGFTYADFAPLRPGDPVRADCRVAPERVAAVHRALAEGKR